MGEGEGYISMNGILNETTQTVELSFMLNAISSARGSQHSQSSNINEILDKSNSDPKIEELGSKSMNSMKLQKINEQSGGELYLCPESIFIPMSIPAKFLD